MDVAKAFTFVTEDERWMGKIGIGALVSLASFLIVPIPLLVGYLVGITRNVKDGVERPLPEWDDFGQLFKDGLSVIVGQIVYTLPFWIIMCIAIVASVGLGGLADGNVNEDVVATGFLATWGLVICLSLIFAIVLFFLSPAIVIQYIRTNELGAMFRFGEVVAIARENISDIVITALATFLASFVISTVIGVFSAIPIIGWCGGPILGIAVGPYLTAVTGHLYGQIAAKGESKEAKSA
ncbi:MAG: DUF4013 domain-containing protein [Ardenticatenaceae bacterium]|nr:DUF4013 domain-containing protein [Ardenticatenaceae bacterium]MCB9445389.1 DUF4013 domain-containing protein [Ardenticatenaceae bacterium]